MENCGILYVTFSHIAGTDEHFEHDIRPHSGNDGNTGAHITAEKAVKKGNAVDCKTAYVLPTQSCGQPGARLIVIL